MCGIYGSTVYYSDDDIKAKLERVRFRGPDHSGFERVEDVILGHNRLAIIDLDHRSDQPFTYLHLKIVFNGEIYNYQSIRAALITEGYRFTTDSDTEVIAAAYLRYGAECVKQFNGMFAFAIYDTKQQTFFGARDRLGKKPFYYLHKGQQFEFASQPSQITLFRETNLDRQAINAFFIWGYVPEPQSAWQGINKLPAGHSFKFSLQTGLLTIEKYWDIDLTGGQKFDGDYTAAKSELHKILLDAVGIRMHADVDLGVFLSGGIDSSLVAAIGSRQATQLKTFCIKFNEQKFDESVFASQIARHLKTDHHVIECTAAEGMALIDRFGEYYDEPFADASAIPSILLNKYTKKYVTVALSGDGGDESFMGYRRYKWLKSANTLFGIPLKIRRALAGIIALSPNYRHKLIAEGIAFNDIETVYATMLGGLDYTWLQNPVSGLQVPFMDILQDKSISFLKRMSAFDIKTYLNGDINTKVDRASMAFAVEARAPLMDHRVVTFGLQLPDEFKFSGGVQKKILKDILFDYVPKQYFDRPKSGFSVPLRHWFRHELKEYVLDQLSAGELHNIPGIDVPKVTKMIDEHMSGKWNRYPQIWKLLVFMQWLKTQKNDARQLIAKETAA
jgi:asparagine synthase (glutamine-hydrolysing)